jgi:hypothetical protein
MNGPEDWLHERFSPMNRHSPARIERPFRANRRHMQCSKLHPFDHLVASREQQWAFEAEHLPWPSEKVEGLFDLTKMK